MWNSVHANFSHWFVPCIWQVHATLPNAANHEWNHESLHGWLGLHADHADLVLVSTFKTTISIVNNNLLYMWYQSIYVYVCRYYKNLMDSITCRRFKIMDLVLYSPELMKRDHDKTTGRYVLRVAEFTKDDEYIFLSYIQE
jgi:hypothetical protein